MGYSWSHAIFLLVYAAVGFRASCNVPPGTMRCLLIVGTIGNATYHCAMAIICWSSSATALMHQQLDGNPLMRIRVLQLAVFFHTVIFPVTSHFSRSGINLITINVLALANAALLYGFWFGTEGDLETRPLALTFIISSLFSHVFIFSAARSRVIAFNLFVLGPAFSVALNLLSVSFPFDRDGRQLPLTPADVHRPHAGVVLYALIFDIRNAAVHIGICHAVVSQSSLRSAASSLPASLAASGWRLLPLFIIVVGIISQKWLLEPPVLYSRPLLHSEQLWTGDRPRRKLLSGEPGLDISWVVQCASCLLLVLIMGVAHLPQKKRTRESESSSTAGAAISAGSGSVRAQPDSVSNPPLQEASVEQLCDDSTVKSKGDVRSTQSSSSQSSRQRSTADTIDQDAPNHSLESVEVVSEQEADPAAAARMDEIFQWVHGLYGDSHERPKLWSGTQGPVAARLNTSRSRISQRMEAGAFAQLCATTPVIVLSRGKISQQMDADASEQLCATTPANDTTATVPVQERAKQCTRDWLHGLGVPAGNLIEPAPDVNKPG